MKDNETLLGHESNLFKKKNINLSKKRKNTNKNAIIVNKFLKITVISAFLLLLKKLKEKESMKPQKLKN